MAGTAPEIRVLSNRADLVSGGDALIEVQPPKHIAADRITVSLNGKDVTAKFAVRPTGRYQALLTGLRDGRNEVTARVSGGSRNTGAKLTVTNHSDQGPIFAGPQVQPWICETEKFGLGPANGSGCAAPTRYDYFYKSTETNKFEPYDLKMPPASQLVASTTTDEGVTVPYIVRRERGVMDRGIYDIAALFDPDAAWQPWAPQKAWNGKLLAFFHAGASLSHKQGGRAGIPDVFNVQNLGDLPLSRGFAVMTSTLLFGANSMNDIVQAEALTMMKEHFIEDYGPVRYTLSVGWSGGSVPQYTIADNYPGLLDGIAPWWSAPDWWTWTALDVNECSQLGHYFEKADPRLWANPADKAAVGGAPPDGSWCGPTHSLSVSTDRTNLDPRFGCTSSDPEPEWVYNPQTNTRGTRCTLQDYLRGVFAPRASDGFAMRPVDNVGVQYGLTPLLRGQISAAQFVDLNAKVGGTDIDNNWIPARTKADLSALHTAYQAGRIVSGRQLAKVPIFDLESPDGVDIHAKVRPMMLRDRLVAANGHAKNMVLWDANSFSEWTTMAREAFLTLDQWVAGIKADVSNAPVEVKVLRHKPTEARDTCWTDGKPGAECRPTYSKPRIVAGGPVANDILKCQLKPLDWKDYGPIKFTTEQKHMLRTAFPTGVCDWTKRGVGQQEPKATWLTFMNGTGGDPLGPPPRSEPIRR
ncbi:hypothetical protein E1218_12250 [Kribbella turkmenica]|uniref:DUF6351 domain-containing protein n=2 Tax=Kribbella turkmenica TaxID=2530375 RepID=A0A4V2YGF9_9ACTN|nr:hypothetical protein E1218_12250 [Kribbella turkmenica]